MNHPILLPKNTFTRSLWKNGLGYTDQIAIEPVGADLRSGNYLWRISSASIENASVFSIFPDHDRALVILSGAGLKLVHEDDGFQDATELPPLEPYEFPGDIQSRCELLGGPVKDLSVFFRKGIVSASLEVVRLEAGSTWSWMPAAAWNFLFAVTGSVGIKSLEGVTEVLPAGDAFRVDVEPGRDGNGIAYPITSHTTDAVLVAIALWR